MDFSKWVKDGFGTADAIIVSDDVLRIIDFKYGLGVLVSAENNSQMRCYALGTLSIFDGIYDIERVSMTIYQPRRMNVSTAEITKDELLTWADEVLSPAAKLAYAGKGDYSCGEWCGFCKAKNDCRARAEANLRLARYDFKMPPLLTDEEVEVILSRVDNLVSWAKDIKEYALKKALKGKTWNGYKLVEGRSVRHYTDERAVANTVAAAGYDPYKKMLLGITEMQKMLGRTQFTELLSPYIEKPQGKLTLVPESDKRPAVNTEDFKED